MPVSLVLLAAAAIVTTEFKKVSPMLASYFSRSSFETSRTHHANIHIKRIFISRVISMASLKVRGRYSIGRRYTKDEMET
jgi:hypothetical protein